MIIKLAFEKSDLISPTILNLCHNVNQLGLLSGKEKNTIALSVLNWVRPLAILPIASLLFDLQRRDYKFDIIKPTTLDAGSYLIKTLKFFEGSIPVIILDAIKTISQSYLYRTNRPRLKTGIKFYLVY